MGKELHGAPSQLRRRVTAAIDATMMAVIDITIAGGRYSISKTDTFNTEPY
jgi:hypothetical protein